MSENTASRRPASGGATVAPLTALLDGKSHQHVVQFYGEDVTLIDTLSPLVAGALGAGNSVVVVASKPHSFGLTQRLESLGINTAEAIHRGRYIILDAAETLALFMNEESPNSSLFADIMGAIIERAMTAAGGDHPRVLVFGEMVSLLWDQGKSDATIRIEQLWNELAKKHTFSLCCAYPMGAFGRKEHAEPSLKICGEHSQVIPERSYGELLSENDQLRISARLEQKTLEAESALRESEAQFQRLVERVQDYAIFMLNTEGFVSTWNSGAQRIKGYAAQEIIGKHFSCFYPEEDIRSGKPKRELEIATEVGRVEDEGWRLRKDGSRFWANVIITALRDETGRLCGFSKITRDATEKMRAHEALRDSNAQLRAEIAERILAERKLHDSERSLRRLSGQLLRLQDEERRRFGRELHDSVGQCLAVLKMSLDTLQADIAPHGKGTERQFSECLNLAEQAIKEVRTISYLLHPPMLEELGLTTAIPWYLDGFGKRSGIQTTLDIPGDLGRLPAEVELAIFRVLQESLTNVHRHSGSPTAYAQLLIQDETVCLEVRDNGKGVPSDVLDMDPDALGKLGVGLRGMNERMRELGGSLELISDAKGTTVRALVPLKAAKG